LTLAHLWACKAGNIDYGGAALQTETAAHPLAQARPRTVSAGLAS
jgi:hypothetical protein